MTNLTPERIAELRGRVMEGLNNAQEYVDLFLEGVVKDSWEKRVSFWTDLLALLSDYPKGKAENVRLSKESAHYKALYGEWATAYEKFKDENARLTGYLAEALVKNHAVALATEKNLRVKAEAELDAARPLIEAVMAKPFPFEGANKTVVADIAWGENILREALALRESKGEKK